MEGGENMELTQLISLVTIIVTWILGYFAKKSKFISNNLIPIQNILIGLIMAIIEWIATRDFSIAIATSGLLAGGTYDIFNNLRKMIKEIKDESKPNK